MYDVIILGAGPAGIGVLSALYRLSQTRNQKPLKLCIIDGADLGHAGNLSQYNIPSDTRAEKFLTCLDGLPEPVTNNRALKALTQTLRSYGAKAVPLPLAGGFFQIMGEQRILVSLSTRQRLQI